MYEYVKTIESKQMNVKMLATWVATSLRMHGAKKNDFKYAIMRRTILIAQQ